MAVDLMRERERAFEAVYFARVERAFVDRRRRERAADDERARLAAVTGIGDRSMLDDLREVGVTASNIEALSLAPLACIAWADGRLDEPDREAALRAIEEEGVDRGTDGHALFESWLSARPDASLMSAWREYIESIFDHLATLPHELRITAEARLRDEVVARARRVARGAAGFSGNGAISEVRQRLLDEIESSLRPR